MKGEIENNSEVKMDVGRKVKYYLKAFISTFKAKQVISIIQPIDSYKEFEGKVALITGGSGGIGKAIAKMLVNCGCRVIICGTNKDKLIRCARDISPQCKYMVLDLTDISSFEAVVEQSFEVFGAIDILINSAGIHNPSRFNSFLTTTIEDFDKIMNINVKGTYFFSQTVAKKMISEGTKGHICLISSQSAIEPAWSAYRLSKWAEKGMVQGLAQELLKYGIIVNGVAPGPTATSMQGYKDGDSIYTDTNPSMRYVMPEEVAECVKLCVSENGNIIVGDTIYISGGRGIVDIR